MKRLWVVGLVMALAVQSAILASPALRRPRPPRKVVVVHRGFPLKRALRHVYIRPLVRPYRVLPRTFLPLVIWTGTPVTVLPQGHVLVWEDSTTLTRDEDWTEIGLNCENTGTKLWLEVVAGRVQFDWAEVAFGNEEAQVVEMNECVRDPGLYLLFDFAAGREVDHVRLIARAQTPEARIALKMEK